jgi:cytochrome c-type biogenesis protein CcmH/NrfG
MKSKAGKFAPYWIALGVTYYAKNNQREAAKAWKKAIKLEPRNKIAMAYSKLV